MSQIQVAKISHPCLTLLILQSSSPALCCKCVKFEIFCVLILWFNYKKFWILCWQFWHMVNSFILIYVNILKYHYFDSKRISWYFINIYLVIIFDLVKRISWYFIDISCDLLKIMSWYFIDIIFCGNSLTYVDLKN